MIQPANQAGFSAVELLISLFIAVSFIAAGYQLYSVVIKDGAEASLRTRASNIAYTNLRAYSGQATGTCSTVTPSPTPSMPTDFSNSSISVVFTCPYGTSDPISKITVTVQYGNPQKEVVHALYVSGN